MTGVLMRRGNQTHQVTSGIYIHRRKTTMGHREKVAICKPRRETSRETNLKKKRKKKKPTQPEPQAWASNLQYYKKTNFSCLSHPTCVFHDDSSCRLVRLPHFHFVLVPANDVAGFDFVKDNLILLLGDSNPHER